MAITIRTGAALKALLAGEQTACAEGTTVGELLDDLNIRDRLCDDTGKVRRHFNIHINDGEDVRLLQGLDTPVSDGDTVTILSAIAGGAEAEGAPGGRASRKFWLFYPLKVIDKPLIWEIGQKFKIVTNIRQASVSKDIGLVGLEITGDEAEIQKAVSFLEEKGVSVEPVELEIVE